MNNDVNHDKKFEATSEVSPSEFDKDQAGWEDTNILAMKESFVNVVTAELPKKKVNFRTLTNDEQVADSDFVLPLATIAEAKHRFANSLVGFQKVINDEDGFFFFKFASLKGSKQVIEQGPWLIRNTPLILNKWTPNLVLKKEEVTKDPWGRLGFDRTLIEVSADKALKRRLLWQFRKRMLPKRVKEPVIETGNVDKDGFTSVSKKKKKGTIVEKWQPKAIEGIKLTKPKPSFSFFHKCKPSSSKKPKQAHASTKNQFDVLGD
ncbi:retrovirus-related pol polyprotein from transposon TNT 1-94 [Tanacetum coccineum]|uniref:Retrovirus-related pol polyprotein from transposon TNT 1-94 n=1 Tax=Tanacetum coccineum TaxID=301880 RepID=A0ABQ4ZU24_9ASTR